MMNKKVWPLLLILLFGGAFWAFTSTRDRNSDDLLEKQQRLLAAIGIILKERHYDPKPINDNFSKQVFDNYLTTLDPDKTIFLQADIKELSPFSTTIDDEILAKVPLRFYPAAGAIYTKRRDETKLIYEDILSKPFDFTTNESVQMDGKKLDFPADEAARKEVWRKRIKFMTLERLVDLQQQREKSAGKDTSVNKSDKELEEKARQTVLTILNRNFNRLTKLYTLEEQFNSFVNVITDLMDPHTEYMAPVEKRQFDEEISGRFYGIGAQLREENGTVKIASLITGSPAWKSGKIQVGDEVIKVAQGNDVPVDVQGYAITDVVKLIRGSKGSEVKITFKKADGTTQVVSIIRDEILLEDTFARSAVVEDNGKKIGYIYLPDFYFDPNDPKDGPRCSVDVAKEVVKLQGEKVDGIIIDLRNNGGGSLNEVVKMVGLFIDQGPVVQVKGRDGKPSLWSDDEPGQLYSGPLAVMVNELSASASEIFAAAIQDYKRGIVIGTPTYGKGTVQTALPLGRPMDMSGQPEYGALKITFQKFYRVNGGSTQLRGVTPDIILPDPYEYLKLREKDNPTALKWDRIPAADYLPLNNNWDTLEKNETVKIKNSNTFNQIKTNTDWLGENLNRNYALNITTYKKEQSLVRNTVKQDDSLIRLKQPMAMEPVQIDRDKYYSNQDSVKGDRNMQWLKMVRSDLYINEAVHIISDMMTKPAAVTVKE